MGMVKDTNFLTLRDGRRLCYAIYNAEVATTAFGFNGTPNCRLSGGPPAGVKLRMIHFDRPGYGQSDPNPGLTHLDVADDALQLADHLGVDPRRPGAFLR
jgi:pimeloyl-ACP methyl ester carboxylesterase